MTMDEPGRVDQSTPWWTTEVPGAAPVVPPPLVPPERVSSLPAVLSVPPAPAPVVGIPIASPPLPPATGQVALPLPHQNLAPSSGPPPYQDPSRVVCPSGRGVSDASDAAGVRSNGRMAPGRIVGLIVGLLLFVAGLILGVVLLIQRTGPGGLCGSVFDQAGNGFVPCDDAITNQILTAGLIGGFLVLAGVVTVVVSLLVGRAPRRPGG